MPTGFINLPGTGAVVSTVAFPYANSATADPVSSSRDSGSGAPDYTSVLESASLGNTPGDTLEVPGVGALGTVDSAP